MTTTHQYLDKYPISADSEKLIVGTIHPNDHENFEIPFFYGNMTSIWTILSEVFPNDLIPPFTVDKIVTFLKNKNSGSYETRFICAGVC